MRRDIEFNAEGVILRGWLYLPEKPAGRAPAIVGARASRPVAEAGGVRGSTLGQHDAQAVLVRRSRERHDHGRRG